MSTGDEQQDYIIELTARQYLHRKETAELTVDEDVLDDIMEAEMKAEVETSFDAETANALSIHSLTLQCSKIDEELHPPEQSQLWRGVKAKKDEKE